MSVLKKSALIGTPGLIANYANISRDVNLVPENVRNRQLSYGTSLILSSGGGDISNIVFTLTGNFNGHLITEQIIIRFGEGAVSSTYFYDNILSLTASADSVEPLFLQVGDKLVVVFDSYNSSNVNNINYNKIDIMAKSIEAFAGWGRALENDGNPAGYFVYGLSIDRPNTIPISYVVPTMIEDGVGYPSNPYLTFINNIEDNITQNDIQNGYFVNTIYPYKSIIVYISGVIQTSSFIEIRQS